MRLVDALVAAAICSVIIAGAVPILGTSRSALQGELAARLLVSTFHAARAHALRTGAVTGVRFVVDERGVQFALFADGNGDGLRTADITRGVDRQVGPWRRVEDDSPRVAVAIRDRLPGIDGGPALEAGSQAVRFGTSGIASFTMEGTASSGTVYLTGSDGTAYAVRLLGATGRVRWLRFDRATGRWEER